MSDAEALAVRVNVASSAALRSTLRSSVACNAADALAVRVFSARDNAAVLATVRSSVANTAAEAVAVRVSVVWSAAEAPVVLAKVVCSAADAATVRSIPACDNAALAGTVRSIVPSALNAALAATVRSIPACESAAVALAVRVLSAWESAAVAVAKRVSVACNAAVALAIRVSVAKKAALVVAVRVSVACSAALADAVRSMPASDTAALAVAVRSTPACDSAALAGAVRVLVAAIEALAGTLRVSVDCSAALAVALWVTVALNAALAPAVRVRVALSAALAVASRVRVVVLELESSSATWKAAPESVPNGRTDDVPDDPALLTTPSSINTPALRMRWFVPAAPLTDSGESLYPKQNATSVVLLFVTVTDGSVWLANALCHWTEFVASIGLPVPVCPEYAMIPPYTHDAPVVVNVYDDGSLPPAILEYTLTTKPSDECVSVAASDQPLGGLIVASSTYIPASSTSPDATPLGLVSAIELALAPDVTPDERYVSAMLGSVRLDDARRVVAHAADEE